MFIDELPIGAVPTYLYTYPSYLPPKREEMRSEGVYCMYIGRRRPNSECAHGPQGGAFFVDSTTTTSKAPLNAASRTGTASHSHGTCVPPEPPLHILSYLGTYCLSFMVFFFFFFFFLFSFFFFFLFFSI